MKKTILSLVSLASLAILSACSGRDLSNITVDEAIDSVIVRSNHYTVVNDNDYANRDINNNKSLAEASQYTKEDYKNVQFSNRFTSMVSPSGFNKTVNIDNLFTSYSLANSAMGYYNFYPNQVKCNSLSFRINTNQNYNVSLKSISFKILVDDITGLYLSTPYDSSKETELTINYLDRSNPDNLTKDVDGYISITSNLLGMYDSIYITSDNIKKVKDVSIGYEVKNEPKEYKSHSTFSTSWILK